MRYSHRIQSQSLLPTQIFNPILRPKEPEGDGAYLLHLGAHLDSTIRPTLASLEEGFYSEAARGNPEIIFLEGATDTLKSSELKAADIDPARIKINENREIAEALYVANMGNQELGHLAYYVLSYPLHLILNIIPTTNPIPDEKQNELKFPANPTDPILYSSTSHFSQAISIGAAVTPRINQNFKGSITLSAKLNINKQRFELVRLSFSGTPLFNKYIHWFATQAIPINFHDYNTHLHQGTLSTIQKNELLQYAGRFIEFLDKEDHFLFEDLIWKHAIKLFESEAESTPFSQCLAYDYAAVMALLKEVNQPNKHEISRKTALKIATRFTDQFITQLNVQQKQSFCEQVILLCQHFPEATAERKSAEKYAFLYLGYLNSPTEIFDQKHAYRKLPRSSKIAAAFFIALFVTGAGVAALNFFVPFLPAVTIAGLISLKMALLLIFVMMTIITALGHVIHIHRTQMDVLQKSLEVLENIEGRSRSLSETNAAAMSPSQTATSSPAPVPAPAHSPSSSGEVSAISALDPTALAPEFLESPMALGK